MSVDVQAVRKGDESALRALYLSYVNDFLTVAGCSAYYGLSQGDGAVYIAMGRELHEEHCAKIKESRHA